MIAKIMWLGQCPSNQSDLLGGKITSLNQLSNKYPVPPGFLLSTDAFEAWLFNEKPDEINPELYKAIAEAYISLCQQCGIENLPVAVRSSAVGEDGENASYAGQYNTYLNVVGIEAIAKAIVSCWQSTEAERVKKYRSENKQLEKTKMAVLVQQLVPAEVSGIAFSINPVTNSSKQIVINSSWGLGESVVGGTVTPDVYTVIKSCLSLAKREIASKQKITIQVSNGVQEIGVPYFLQKQSSLTDKQIIELAQLVFHLENETRKPVDIEFAFHCDKLYLLQCRAITTFVKQTSATPESIPSDFPIEWETPNDIEIMWQHERAHFPLQPTPLEFSLATLFTYNGFNKAAKTYGIPIHRKAKHWNSFAYVARVPTVLPEDMPKVSNIYMSNLYEAIQTVEKTWNNEWLPEIKEYLKYWESYELNNADLTSLGKHLEMILQHQERLWEIHFLLFFPSALAMSLFEEMYQEFFPEADFFEVYELLSGFESETVIGGKLLWNLSRKIIAEPNLLKVFKESNPEKIIKNLGCIAEGQDFLNDFKQYLDKYGKRGDKIGFRFPFWNENPNPVILNLKSYIEQPDKFLVEEMENIKKIREQKTSKAFERIAKYPKVIISHFQFLLKTAQFANIMVEDHPYWLDFPILYHNRQIILKIGALLQESNTSLNKNDIFYLTLEELQEMIKNPSLDYNQRIQERQKLEANYKGYKPPLVIGTKSPPPSVKDPLIKMLMKRSGGTPTIPNHPNELKGFPGSSGTVMGIAKIVLSLSEIDKLEPGDILVTETTMAPWTPLFASISGLVTDTGGILCHAAIVAREYKIPAVVGTTIGTRSIQDGQTIEVDGNSGIVRIIT